MSFNGLLLLLFAQIGIDVALYPVPEPHEKGNLGSVLIRGRGFTHRSCGVVYPPSAAPEATRV